MENQMYAYLKIPIDLFDEKYNELNKIIDMKSIKVEIKHDVFPYDFDAVLRASTEESRKAYREMKKRQWNLLNGYSKSQLDKMQEAYNKQKTENNENRADTT